MSPKFCLKFCGAKKLLGNGDSFNGDDANEDDGGVVAMMMARAQNIICYHIRRPRKDIKFLEPAVCF